MRHKKTTPPNNEEAVDFWVMGVGRVIGTLKGVTILENGKNADLFFTVDDGREELVIKAESVIGYGDIPLEEAA